MSFVPADITASEKTLADRALRLLREDILAARLAPDTRLRIVELQTRYGLGISPLREALLRLASEGLVVAEGQRGFAVASVSLAELEDLTRARIRLESAILAEAIEQGDAEWEAGMIAALHRLSRTPLPHDAQDAEAIDLWEERHRAFHQSLVAGCGSVWLLRMHAQLTEHSERYRRVRLFHSMPPLQLARKVDEEHQALMQALLDRDTPRVAELVKQHLEYTARVVASLWKIQQTEPAEQTV
ncbi:MAG: FCD domain-containing protein [Polaromonas sp.]|uniref:FCD domain-containing protein n=1 Tax=Polaromonas sp. TaxID=1869339 RepID=UPI002736AAAD|nr:FCD domain-containing protein [Polaromonas sp.]MDP3797349.1 FCD domain-containing protein [Polaromonas sp.]